MCMHVNSRMFAMHIVLCVCISAFVHLVIRMLWHVYVLLLASCCMFYGSCVYVHAFCVFMLICGACVSLNVWACILSCWLMHACWCV